MSGKKKSEKNNVTEADHYVVADPFAPASNSDASDDPEGLGANAGLILKELRDFRKDNGEQLGAIRSELAKANTRISEAEDRIDLNETRVQSIEEVLSQLLKLQIQTENKLLDLEGRSKRENIRIYSVKEGQEENPAEMSSFVENLLRVGLELPDSFELRVERAHRSLTAKPPADATPRSIVAKLSSYRVKDELIRLAWKKKGFFYMGKKVNLDNDYASGVIKKRNDYDGAKEVLKANNIRFKTRFPARLRVEYEDGHKMYESAEEATADMKERGYDVEVIPSPVSLLDQVKKLTWSVGKNSGTQGLGGAEASSDYKGRLRVPSQRKTKESQA